MFYILDIYKRHNIRYNFVKYSNKQNFKKFKSGTKYYVRVRAYEYFNGKIKYGAWSDIKSVTLK
jgi:hypothetical protein